MVSRYLRIPLSFAALLLVLGVGGCGSSSQVEDLEDIGWLEPDDETISSEIAAPLNVRAFPGDRRVTLEWDDSTDRAFAYFAVRRGTQPDTNKGTWTRLPGSHTTSTITDTDASLENGSRVFYYVTAIDTEGVVSARSMVVSATPTSTVDTTPPAAPTGLTVQAGDRKVTLNWADNTEPDFAYYAVRRSTHGDPNGSWTRLPGNHTTSMLEDADTSLVNGTRYFYFVTAVDGSGNYSGRSTMVSVTPIGSVSPAPKWVANMENGNRSYPFGVWANAMWEMEVGSSGKSQSSLVPFVTTDQFRSGGHALKWIFPAHAKRAAMVAAYPKWRDEADLWFGMSVRFGSDWRDDDTGSGSSKFMILASWRCYVSSSLCPNGSNSISLSGGRMSFGRTYQGGGVYWPDGLGADSIDLGRYDRNTWIDLVFHIRFSEKNGLREVWRNGVLLGRKTSATIAPSMRGAPHYFKVGPYSGTAVDHTRTLWIDNVKIGTSYEAVDPSRN